MCRARTLNVILLISFHARSEPFFPVVVLCRKDAELSRATGKERGDMSWSAQEMETLRQAGTKRPGSAHHRDDEAQSNRVALVDAVAWMRDRSRQPHPLLPGCLGFQVGTRLAVCSVT